MEREMVTVAICYSETDVKLYSFNVNTDLSGYIAAALVSLLILLYFFLLRLDQHFLISVYMDFKVFKKNGLCTCV